MEKILEEDVHYKALGPSDRCDRCGDSSQAYVRAVIFIENLEYELLFCGHHFNKYHADLVAGGWLIQDERNTIAR